MIDEIVEHKKWAFHWFENDPNKNRNKRLEEMCICYEKKYGVFPNFVYVPLSEVVENEDELKFNFGVVKVKTDKQCLKNCYWATNEESLKDIKK